MVLPLWVHRAQARVELAIGSLYGLANLRDIRSLTAKDKKLSFSDIRFQKACILPNPARDPHAGADYIFGLAGNAALDALAAETAVNLRFYHAMSRKPKLRTYASFLYQAGSWRRPRKVVARLECSLQPGENGMRQEVDIRYVVTSLRGSARHLYENVYCQRGQMENLIKLHKAVPTASAILDDGTIVEMTFRPELRRTLFAIYNAGRWTLQDAIDLGPDAKLVPFSANNNLIKNQVVLLPSEPQIYGNEAQLVAEIREFIRRYVDFGESFENVATHYVLLSWLYDAFNELPYLRLRGDYGSGKTRALLTIGSLCYKGFFASGASTVSPIFHTLDAFRGTLIFDEADFRFSDERAEIVKILNNGNVSGLPVLRTMMNRQREFNPQAFQVFGPKIVATRGSYEDKGLESRFLTEEMGSRKLRSDIPINLPDSFKEEARELRNKLLLYRFHRRHEVKLDETLVDPRIEPRLNQILLPLMSVVADDSLRSELRSMAVDAQLNLVADRGLLVEAQLLEILAELIAGSQRPVIPVADIAAGLIERYGDEYDRPITNRWVGSVLRKRLNIRTYKSHGPRRAA